VVSVIRDIDARKRQELDLAVAAGMDPLTGLPNRRAFALEFGHRGNGPCSMALIDIDHFKLINDQHGHAAGDAALKRFASVARNALRKHDFLARIGGEEFAILFRGLCAIDAQDICERVRKEVARAVTFHDGQAIRFTISAGVTDLGSDLDSTLAIADGALYQAKRAGRDRLELAA
jgi:diguanylate cyclase (GGDEF)-like protein